MPIPGSPTTAPRPDRVLPTDAAIEAAVRRLLAEVTGVSTPPDSATRCYQRAVDVVADEVTELLAVLTHHG